MDIEKYQKLAQRTMNTDLTDREAYAMLAMGLAGEAGEVVDYLKKVVFHDHELDEQYLKDEMGDVLWYFSNLLNVLGLTFEQVAERNIEKLEKRYPNGFSSEDSKNRKEYNPSIDEIVSVQQMTTHPVANKLKSEMVYADMCYDHEE